MNVTTANRFHLGEIVLSSMLRVPRLALLGVRLEQLASPTGSSKSTTLPRGISPPYRKEKL